MKKWTLRTTKHPFLRLNKFLKRNPSKRVKVNYSFERLKRLNEGRMKWKKDKTEELLFQKHKIRMLVVQNRDQATMALCFKMMVANTTLNYKDSILFPHSNLDSPFSKGDSPSTMVPFLKDETLLRNSFTLRDSFLKKTNFLPDFTL